MFKLKTSADQARKLAAKESERYQMGNTGWATVRFTTEDPLPSAVWMKWLDESYLLSCVSQTKNQ